jgi:hypothetical protein
MWNCPSKLDAAAASLLEAWSLTKYTLSAPLTERRLQSFQNVRLNRIRYGHVASLTIPEQEA